MYLICRISGTFSAALLEGSVDLKESAARFLPVIMIPLDNSPIIFLLKSRKGGTRVENYAKVNQVTPERSFTWGGIVGKSFLVME